MYYAHNVLDWWWKHATAFCQLLALIGQALRQSGGMNEQQAA